MDENDLFCVNKSCDCIATQTRAPNHTDCFNSHNDPLIWLDGFLAHFGISHTVHSILCDTCSSRSITFIINVYLFNCFSLNVCAVFFSLYYFFTVFIFFFFQTLLCLVFKCGKVRFYYYIVSKLQVNINFLSKSSVVQEFVHKLKKKMV